MELARISAKFYESREMSRKADKRVKAIKTFRADAKHPGEYQLDESLTSRGFCIPNNDDKHFIFQEGFLVSLNGPPEYFNSFHRRDI